MAELPPPAPMTETMRELFRLHHQLLKEVETCRIRWREEADAASLLERNYKVGFEKALARVAGTGDAAGRKAKAESEMAEDAYQLDLQRHKARSAWAAWEARLKMRKEVSALAWAYHKELSELGG